MKKLSLFAILFIVLLIGCTNQRNQTSPDDTTISLSIPLEIAVIDGLIVLKENFEEASKKEYKKFFKTIKYPVFFIETQDILADVFHNENLSLDHIDLNGSGPYASGFVSTEDGFNQWYLYLPNDPTSKDEGINMYGKIFEIIQKHKQNTN